MYHVKTDNIIKKVVLLVLAITLLAFKLPFNTGEECKNVLYTYFAFLKEKNKNRTGKTYYSEYTTWNKFNKNEEFPDVKTTTKVFSSFGKMMLENDNIKIYADTTIVFVVLPQLKQIYLDYPDPRMFIKNETYNDLIKVEEVLLKSTNEIVCSDSNGMTEFTIIPSNSFKGKTHLKKQHIIYNNKENRIFKIDNSYTELHKLKRQIVQYDVLEFNSKRSMKSPKYYVFNGNTLKPKFSKFEIIDNRNTSE